MLKRARLLCCLVLCVSRAVLSVVLGAWSVRFVGWADWVDCRCFLFSLCSPALPGVWSFLRVTPQPQETPSGSQRPCLSTSSIHCFHAHVYTVPGLDARAYATSLMYVCLMCWYPLTSHHSLCLSPATLWICRLADQSRTLPRPDS